LITDDYTKLYALAIVAIVDGVLLMIDDFDLEELLKLFQLEIIGMKYQLEFLVSRVKRQ